VDSTIKNTDNFREFKRSAISEMRKVDLMDIAKFKDMGVIQYTDTGVISMSEADIQAGSPKLGDMIARNPKNYKDQWLVAEQYFKDNFEAY